jgi:hypothetical protein
MQYKLPIIVTIMLLTHIGTILSTVRRSGGRCSIGVSMDRLLRYFLGQFIRRGTMIFTITSGARFHQAARHRANHARLHCTGRKRGCAGWNLEGGRGCSRTGPPMRISSASCKMRCKACEPTPDGRDAPARPQASARRRARRAVPDAISLPLCQSASTATSAGRVPIAIPGFAGPSSVLFGPLPSTTRKSPARSRITLPRRNAV